MATHQQGEHMESTEVHWALDSTTMWGTLVRPAGPGPFAAVVMVAGSGPTDRDWNSPLLPGSNGSARLIADDLAESGFASLRYDKRASGPHAAENMQHLIGKMSMESHLDELSSAVRLLAEQDFVRVDRLFGLGNSEGNLHVLNYQVHTPPTPLAGLVLIAPPGRAVGGVARTQLAEQLAALPDSVRLLELYDQAIARFVAQQPIAPDSSLPQGVQTLLHALETPANLPFARELWSAEAASLLGQVEVPALVLIGKKDIQVDWRADGGPLEEAARGRADVTLVYPEDANHVLKYEPRPRAELPAATAAASYNNPQTGLDPESMTIIRDWLASHL
jgi:alpha-beta hydrolase superfamily lysophospholipase